MRTFRAVLANTLVASLTTMFVWYAVTFWVYLQTRSVIATAVMAGAYTVSVAGSGVFLGALVDRHPKRRVMLASSATSLALYALALAFLVATPPAAFADASGGALWLLVALALGGAVAGNARGIALSTLVTVLVPAAGRARANGLVGAANGAAFLVAFPLCGLVIGFLGVRWVFAGALGLTLLAIAHLLTLAIPAYPEGAGSEGEARAAGVDLRGTIRAIRRVPGLLGLIIFGTFNNFLGGVLTSLIDAYGLLLVSVQVWGALWGFLSLASVLGGLVVARRGLGARPLRTLFLANIAMWAVCACFTLRSSVASTAAGLFAYLALLPVVEAAEQTILQQVVPPERQGRVFGLAQSVEQAAAPVTAFAIGPVAELAFIPFMTTGAGVVLVGGWFGTGAARGLALLFTLAGLLGLLVTLLAMRTPAYRALAARYRGPGPTADRAVSDAPAAGIGEPPGG